MVLHSVQRPVEFATPTLAPKENLLYFGPSWEPTFLIPNHIWKVEMLQTVLHQGLKPKWNRFHVSERNKKLPEVTTKVTTSFSGVFHLQPDFTDWFISRMRRMFKNV